MEHHRLMLDITSSHHDTQMWSTLPACFAAQNCSHFDHEGPQASGLLARNAVLTEDVGDDVKRQQQTLRDLVDHRARGNVSRRNATECFAPSLHVKGATPETARQGQPKLGSTCTEVHRQ